MAHRNVTRFKLGADQRPVRAEQVGIHLAGIAHIAEEMRARIKRDATVLLVRRAERNENRGLFRPAIVIGKVAMREHRVPAAAILDDETLHEQRQIGIELLHHIQDRRKGMDLRQHFGRRLVHMHRVERVDLALALQRPGIERPPFPLPKFHLRGRHHVTQHIKPGFAVNLRRKRRGIGLGDGLADVTNFNGLHGIHILLLS